jgi:hypothetical protein
VIPTIHHDEFIEKLKLGFTGRATFSRSEGARFYLTDRDGNRLSRVRKEDWQRVLEHQPVVVEVARIKGGVLTILKYDFASRD